MRDEAEAPIEVTAQALIRTRVEMFLPRGWDPLRWLLELAHESVLISGAKISVRQHSHWWLLESGEDWFGHWDDPFQRLTPLPGIGPNSCSYLAIGPVLSTGVATWTPGEGWTAVTGSEVPDLVPDPGARRAIVVKAEPAGHGSCG